MFSQHPSNFMLPFSDSFQPHKEMKGLFKSVGFNVLHCSYRERTYSAQDAEKLPRMSL